MLIKTLALIAAKELKNTRGIHPQYKEQLKLVEAAYGESTVEADFREWARSVKDNPPEYPISEYMKLVDKRLADSAPIEKTSDPQIAEISAVVLELTDRLPPRQAVEKALETCSQSELIDSFREYVSKLEDRELKYAPRDFFTGGGYEAVLAVRRKKANELENSGAFKAAADAFVVEEKARKDRIDQENERIRKEEESIPPDALY